MKKMSNYCIMFAVCLTATLSNAALLLEWNFDGDALDSSGNGYHGTITNGALDSVGFVEDTIKFSHLKDRVVSPNVTISGAFTAGGWIKVEEGFSEAWNRFLCTDDHKTGFFIGQDGASGKWKFRVNEDNALPLAGTIAPGVWQHVMATFDGVNVAKLYIDGEEVSSTTNMSPQTVTSQPFVLGRDKLTYNKAFKGQFDQVQLYDTALSSNEISAVVQDSEMLPPSSLEASMVIGVGVGLDWLEGRLADTYNVYRSTNSGTYGAALATSVSDISYVDATAVEGETYYYVVSSVDTGSVESAFSDELEVFVDFTPPAAPTGLALTPDANALSFDLAWAANGESDFASYSVYHSTVSGVFGVPLEVGITNNVLNTVPPVFGVTNYYVVTATDATGNQSAESAEVSGLLVDATETMVFVPIGNAGNTGETHVYEHGGERTFGAVAYPYKISATEVTIEEMVASGAGDGDETHWLAKQGTTAPAAQVTLYEAMKFCNYLTSGDVNSGYYSTSDGGATYVPNALSHDAYATANGLTYFVPTEDEWYKAAYYDASGANGYSLYANGVDTDPINEVDAFFNKPRKSAKPVGSYLVEQNGTYDMMGNVAEWVEAVESNGVGVIRGGRYASAVDSLSSTNRSSWALDDETRKNGFRPVSINPETGPAVSWEAWLSGFALGTSTGFLDHADSDDFDNLAEYAFGGDPSDGGDRGNTPVQSQVVDGETNYLEYVYFERDDAALLGLESILTVGTGLVSTNWADGSGYEVGSGASGISGFNAVTNRIPTDAEVKQFIRLQIKFTP